MSDLLSTGDADGSEMRLFLERVDLAQLVQLTLDDVEQRLDAADLELHVKIEPAVHVVGDPGRLAQVIDNLLSNAVKYTLPGGSIAVTLAEHEGEIQLCVSDTGIGVSELDQEELFTKFSRARDATECAVPQLSQAELDPRNLADSLGPCQPGVDALAMVVATNAGCCSRVLLSVSDRYG